MTRKAVKPPTERYRLLGRIAIRQARDEQRRQFDDLAKRKFRLLKEQIFASDSVDDELACWSDSDLDSELSSDD
jgi:hypothetical protein